MMKSCPNCLRDFNGNPLASAGEYCPECWNRWCRNDGSFERRTKSLADAIAEAVNK